MAGEDTWASAGEQYHSGDFAGAAQTVQQALDEGYDPVKCYRGLMLAAAMQNDAATTATQAYNLIMAAGQDAIEKEVFALYFYTAACNQVPEGTAAQIYAQLGLG